MTNKMLSAALAAALSLAVHQSAVAQESPWLVRGRLVQIEPDNKDSTGLDLSLNSKLIPEVDISYFFTPNIAAELILTYPQKHDLKSGGTKIGSVKHLPPTLSLQYHFLPSASIRPYVGAGLNYTLFSDEELPAGVTIDDSSVGWSIQAGVDIPINKNLSINVDIKKVKIETDVKAGGSKLGTFKVDPILFGIGVGWRF